MKRLCISKQETYPPISEKEGEEGEEGEEREVDNQTKSFQQNFVTSFFGL